MSMTLGFDVGRHLDVLLAEDAHLPLLALARHAPGGPLRVATHEGRYRVEEIARDGARSVPTDEPAILAAIAKRPYVAWANDAAPEWVPPLILPGPGWDLDALRAEPGMKRLIAANRFCAQITSSDVVKRRVGPQGRRLLAVAEAHRLVTVFG